MSFSVFFNASLAPTEDSYKYESRAAFILHRWERSSGMSVLSCNENPNKLTQKWLVSNKFYAGYYAVTGMNSFLYKTQRFYSQSITLCSPV